MLQQPWKPARGPQRVRVNLLGLLRQLAANGGSFKASDLHLIALLAGIQSVPRVPVGSLPQNSLSSFGC